ncbi:UNVERIFIED_CONTAM: hypothetical protein RMT77_008349 [Armadillidium vulgare]
MSKMLVCIFILIFVGLFVTKANESDGPDKPVVQSESPKVTCKYSKHYNPEEQILDVCEGPSYLLPNSCKIKGCPKHRNIYCCYNGCYYVCEMKPFIYLPP